MIGGKRLAQRRFDYFSIFVDFLDFELFSAFSYFFSAKFTNLVG